MRIHDVTTENYNKQNQIPQERSRELIIKVRIHQDTWSAFSGTLGEFIQRREKSQCRDREFPMGLVKIHTQY
jgi:hypothetical protein